MHLVLPGHVAYDYGREPYPSKAACDVHIALAYGVSVALAHTLSTSTVVGTVPAATRRLNMCAAA